GVLKRMLIREDELRRSPEIQERYAQAEISNDQSWLDVTHDLQKQIIKEFGLEDEMDDALNCLRCATQIYPDLKDIPLYIRNNRARDGDLHVGSIAPDTPIIKLDGSESRLFDSLEQTEQSTVIISGSYS
ncbi:unnamed protein product, partial [Didymodactylos carnosus]